MFYSVKCVVWVAVSVVLLCAEKRIHNIHTYSVGNPCCLAIDWQTANIWKASVTKLWYTKGINGYAA